MTSANLCPSEINLLESKGHRLKNLIGEGTFAKVILTEYTYYTKEGKSKKVSLACKITDTSRAPHDFVHKFLPREIQILVKIQHPHIIHIHSILQRRTKYFVFMRLAEKGDLMEYVSRVGCLDEDLARVWCRQLALALQYLHVMGIVHRDLKCENVLITDAMNVKLTDFGFARCVDDPKTTLSETYCGSLAYAAPEVIKGLPYKPKQSDVWSLGCVVFAMLNKCMPFEVDNIRLVYEQQMSRRIMYRRKTYSCISRELKLLVFNMLDPDPKTRWTIDDVVASDWFKMDTITNGLSPAEEKALEAAQQEKGTQQPQKLSNPELPVI